MKESPINNAVPVSIGRIVHFYDLGQCDAAMIVATNEATSEQRDEVNLVIWDSLGDRTFGEQIPFYDGDDRPDQTWHWPERV